jgi:hypothetical protein
LWPAGQERRRRLSRCQIMAWSEAGMVLSVCLRVCSSRGQQTKELLIRCPVRRSLCNFASVLHAPRSLLEVAGMERSTACPMWRFHHQVTSCVRPVQCCALWLVRKHILGISLHYPGGSRQGSSGHCSVAGCH